MPKGNVEADRARRNLALAAISSGMFMANLDTTIVSVALPQIGSHLGTHVTALAWVVNGYTLAFASFIMFGGTASDRFGSSAAFRAGLVVFVAASAGCGLAPTIGVLLLARFVQGLGAALFLPASLALVRQIFTDPGERAKAIAIWATIATVAAALGPVIGGAMVDGAGWRSAFLVNVPVGVASLLLAWQLVPRQEGDAARSFDWPGQLTAIATLGAGCYAVVAFPIGASSPGVCLSVLCALFTGFAFLAIELKSQDPMVQLRWFRNRVFAIMTTAGSLAFFAYFGLLFALSLYLQGDRHFSAHAAGFTLLPMALSLSVGNLLSQRLVGRLNAAHLLACGLGLAALATPLAVLALVQEWWMPIASAGLFLLGLGASLSVAPMISSVLDQVEPAQAGAASGLLNAMRQTGSLLGVAAASGSMELSVSFWQPVWTVAVVSCVAFAVSAVLSLSSANSMPRIVT